MFKLCVKREQNRTIRCRVIDDLAIFSEGGSSKLYSLEGVDQTLPNSEKTELHRCPNSETLGSDILLRFEMTAAQKRVMLKTMPNLALFDPPL